MRICQEGRNPTLRPPLIVVGVISLVVTVSATFLVLVATLSPCIAIVVSIDRPVTPMTPPAALHLPPLVGRRVWGTREEGRACRIAPGRRIRGDTRIPARRQQALRLRRTCVNT